MEYLNIKIIKINSQ